MINLGMIELERLQMTIEILTEVMVIEIILIAVTMIVIIIKIIMIGVIVIGVIMIGVIMIGIIMTGVIMTGVIMKETSMIEIIMIKVITIEITVVERREKRLEEMIAVMTDVIIIGGMIEEAEILKILVIIGRIMTETVTIIRKTVIVLNQVPVILRVSRLETAGQTRVEMLRDLGSLRIINSHGMSHNKIIIVTNHLKLTINQRDRVRLGITRVILIDKRNISQKI